MAERVFAPDTPELRERWSAFVFTAANKKAADEIIARYPPGRQQSGTIPLLDLAQRQVGAETNTQGWLPIGPSGMSRRHCRAIRADCRTSSTRTMNRS